MEWHLLSGLSDPDRRAVLARATRRRFRSGDSLFHQGDRGDSVHLLAKGHVAVRAVTERGETLTLDVLDPGSVFGEQSLIDPVARRTASAAAIGSVETLMLERATFADLRETHPSITEVLVSTLAAQVRRLSEQLLDAHTLPADERVVKQLRRMVASFASDGAATVPLTQEDLASLAGTTRPTANRALQSLVDAGVIELGRGRIVVADVDALDQR